MGRQLPPHRAFQSTPPARGATEAAAKDVPGWDGISIHAPREGGDGKWLYAHIPQRKFQSTTPARGATRFLPTIQPFCW